MIALLIIIGYVLVMPLAFYSGAKVGNQLENPWETPGPFLAGLLWPVALPFIVATIMCQKSEGLSRVEKKQAKEIAEAVHELKLAKIRTKVHEELDRELALAQKR